MTGPARARLEGPEPLSLTPYIRRHPVSVGPAWCELALVRNAHQGKPVTGRIVLRRRARIGRHDRGQVQEPSRDRLTLRGIHEPVAAHPHAVAGLGEVGQQVPPLIIGDDDLDELGRQIARFGDHPDACFGPARAGNDAADVVAVDVDRWVRLLQERHPGPGDGHERGETHHDHGAVLSCVRLHVPLLVATRGARGIAQLTPTLPCTDAISLLESYPTPSLKTSVTFRMTDGSAGRSPRSTTRSASFPRSTVPSWFSTPRIFAPFAVMIRTAWAGVKPASMKSS